MAQDENPQPGADRRAGIVRALLAEAGAARERVIDDHMFAVERRGQPPATFRLQLFTAPGARPVAVVVQQPGEGASLFNAAERYAQEVWQRHCPGDEAPPVWVQRFVFPSGEDSPFWVVTFPVRGPYLLGAPTRQFRITGPELALLTGTPADADRGSGFQPRPPAPDPELVHEVSWVILLPRPSPFRLPGCMPTGTPWWRRLGRQVLPRRRGRACCWMHRGS